MLITACETRLAVAGGAPIIKSPLRSYKSIGTEECEAVNEVMRSGELSGFIGAWCDEFYGGKKVQEFEELWSARFDCAHTISVNSNTSGLIAALGAIGTGPGDEIIVPPFTMSATAIAPLFYGAIPVFVDLEADYFCLDVEKVEAAITDKTKAILAVDLFGHPAELHRLKALTERRGLFLIEDAAQAPLATERGRYAGTIGDIGVFSLNYHKHIHTGEGGMCCTNDDELAFRLRAIRNHGENIVETLNVKNITNLIGFNFRMTELNAAIGIEQLKKIDQLVERRVEKAEKLIRRINKLPFIDVPPTRSGCKHVYYVLPILFENEKCNLSRAKVAAALSAEGVPISEGYVSPLYTLPLFQRRIAIGREGWPFSSSGRTYPKGLCPIAENLSYETLLDFCVCAFELDDEELELVSLAFEKVFSNLEQLQNLQSSSASV